MNSIGLGLHRGVLYSALVGAATYLAGLKLSRLLCPLATRSAYSKLSQREKIEWDYRLTTNVHALLVATTAVYLYVFTDLFSERQGLSVPVVYRTNWASNWSLGFTTGFFLVDLVFMSIRPGLGGLELTMHHAVVVLGSALAGFGQQAHNYAVAIMATEVTTPLINMRWMLDKVGMQGSPAYLANAVCILALWPIARIALFVAFFHHAYCHIPEILQLPWLSKIVLVIAPGLFFMLNIVWYAKILRIAFKFFLGAPEGKVCIADEDSPAIFAAASRKREE